VLPICAEAVGQVGGFLDDPRTVYQVLGMHRLGLEGQFRYLPRLFTLNRNRRTMTVDFSSERAVVSFEGVDEFKLFARNPTPTP
jgi:hypothetical protein